MLFFILFTYAIFGWTLGVYGQKRQYDILWGICLVASVLLPTYGTLLLVPPEIRWQAETTPEHGEALVLMVVGLAIMYMVGTWGASFYKAWVQQAQKEAGVSLENTANPA